MMGMTTTGEEEEEGLNGTGREKSEGEEKEFEEEKEGKQPRPMRRRLSHVPILNFSSLLSQTPVFVHIIIIVVLLLIVVLG